jgi:antitoxin FitA
LQSLTALTALTAMTAMTTLAGMGTMTIRNIDDDLKRRLRVLAAERDRSMEEEARSAIENWVKNQTPKGSRSKVSSWVDEFRAPFIALGGVDLPEIPREPMREPPKFD